MKTILKYLPGLIGLLLCGGAALAQTPVYSKNDGASGNSTKGWTSQPSNVQILYPPGDISPAVTGPGFINKLFFMYGTLGIKNSHTYNNLTIKLGQTTNLWFNSIIQWPFPVSYQEFSGLTTVFSATSFTVNPGSSGSWFEIPITTFPYDNTKTLIVEITHTGANASLGTYFGTTTQTKNMLICNYGDTTSSSIYWPLNIGFNDILAPCTAPPIVGTTVAAYPNAMCEGKPVHLSLDNQSYNAGQTFQWESSLSSAGPFTPVGGPLTGPADLTIPGAAVATWYRAAVTCSGLTSYSNPVEVQISPLFPGGNYTIDGSLPTAGSNFHSFSEAANAIACGITGPVVFDAAPGTYEEEPVFQDIYGASAANTITIHGHGAILYPASGTSHQSAIVTFKSTSNISIDSLNINVQGPSTYLNGNALELKSGANHNLISQCQIRGHSAIMLNGQNGSCDSNVIENNQINGYGVGIFVDNSSGNQILYNDITNCDPVCIFLDSSDHTWVEDNELHNANGYVAVSFGGVQINGPADNTKVLRNRIHNAFPVNNWMANSDAVGVSAYSVSTAPGNEVEIVNNVIYDFNTDYGDQTGFIVNQSSNVKILHNTVVLDHQNNYTPDPSDIGLDIQINSPYVASGLQFKNNIIYMELNGSEDKFALGIYCDPAAFVSDHNDLYLHGTGFNNGLSVFNGVVYPDLASWQIASGQDMNSISIDPTFQNTAGGNLTPTNLAIDNLGTPVGVLNDLNNTLRSTVTPDMGAIEFLNIPLEIKLIEFTATLKEEDVLTVWTTSNETNTDRYIVERSADGV